MPHGTPDWWGTEQTETVHQVQDVGELAVRLGSPSIFDRRGNVVYWDNFESGLSGWEAGGDGTGHIEVLSAAKAYLGGYSVKLVGGSTNTMQAWIRRYSFPLAEGALGLEMAWNLDTVPVYMQLHLTYYDGTTAHVFRIRYNSVDEDLEYLDDNNAWQDFDSSYLVSTGEARWNVFKVVGDTLSDEYIRAVINGNEYDLSAYSCWTPASAQAPSIYMGATVITTAGNNGVAYVDGMILTQNEP